MKFFLFLPMGEASLITWLGQQIRNQEILLEDVKQGSEQGGLGKNVEVIIQTLRLKIYFCTK
jgi:hypothetical protein